MTADLSKRFSVMSLLCATLVVSIHVGACDAVGTAGWYFTQAISYGLAGIAIPFFFFTSGYFLVGHLENPHWWKDAVRKRCRTLLLPYCIWCIAYFLFESALAIAANVMAHTALTRNIHWPGVVTLFGLNAFQHPALFVMWYVRALFILVLLSPLIVWGLRRLGVWLLLVFFVVYALVAPGDEAVTPHALLPFKWTFSLLGLFYFSVGIFARMRGWSLSLKRPLAIGCLGLGLLALSIQIWARYRGVALPVSPRPLMVGMLGAGLFMLMPGISLPTWLVACAFPIYVLHCFCRVIPWTLWPNASQSAYELPLVWLVTVLLCIACSALLRKFSPKLVEILFGGR